MRGASGWLARRSAITRRSSRSSTRSLIAEPRWGYPACRPDKLKDDFIAALKRVGYRTLTTALDGPSERMRGIIERRGREPHYVAAAERASATAWIASSSI